MALAIWAPILHRMARSVRTTIGFLAAFVLVAAFLVPASARASETRLSSSRSATAALDIGVLEQLNAIRSAHGLTTLTLNPSLSAAARTHSDEMLADGYFAHDSADGSPFWKRIQAFYPQGQFGYWLVGENLFWTAGSSTATQSMNAWMASPEHRANILDPAWRQIGISAATSPDAPGAYSGLSVTVITTDFGVRR
jgi:uncharacterized protein YkwD